MLSLKHICKNYGSNKVLKDINIDFRNQELVAILGESGSGKSTLLNIIGGLDKYDSGDLIIDGISTKKYKSNDWDYYREQKLGFVFQSYNLIEHLNVYDNVNIALMYRKRINKKEECSKILNNFGLKNFKKRNVKSLSGGEKQRVAIARSLVKNPSILLCDEPTGALDSNNSLEVMKILKEISKKKLVIVVTHSEELASKFADRIIKIKDGKLIHDSNKYISNEKNNKKSKNKKKRAVSIFEALKLSFNNLCLRKGRTFLISMAGSIGIVGISLIISLSSGVEKYMQNEEEKAISNYPIKIEKNSYDYNDVLFKDINNEKCHDGVICSNDDISNSDEIVDALA